MLQKIKWHYFKISLASLLIASVLGGSYWISYHQSMKALNSDAKYQAKIITSALFHPVQKHTYFPKVVASDRTVSAVLLDPNNTALVQKANQILAELNAAAGSEVVYLMDRNGDTIAASNWNRQNSFIGLNFSFRPYFKDALQGHDGHFYGMGTVSRSPGYYLSHPVKADGDIIGVVVVKLDLASLDQEWEKNTDFEVTVTDEHDIIFLSSRADWKYRPMRQLHAQDLQVLDQTKQYGASLRTPLHIGQRLAGGAPVWQIRSTNKDGYIANQTDYVVQQKKLDISPWTVSVLMRTEQVHKAALRSAAIVAAIFCLIGIIAMLFIRAQRRRISERMATHLRLKESHERFKIVCKATSDVVWDWDLQCDMLWWNENMQSLFGHLATEIEPGGASWANRIHEEDQARVLEGIHRVIDSSEERWSDEYRFMCQDGRHVEVLDRGFVIRNSAGKAIRMVGSMTDITYRKEYEKAIQRLAFYDPLTQLPNRSLLQERLHQALMNSARTNAVGAVLFLDLDNFKSLNDTLGHDKGDLLLMQVASRLSACVRECDTVSRMGGDEFVILIERLGDNHEDAAINAKIVAKKVLDAFTIPFDLEGLQRHISPSIGISLFNKTNRHMDEVLKAADLAMYEAKSDGRNTMCFFDPKMQELIIARSALETDLHNALDRGELMLHYQVQCDHNGQIISAEALLRWQHPQKGLISPAEFIPIAEQTGLIAPIGCWTLRQACLQLVKWACDPATSCLTVAVNVSARQFHRADFVTKVRAIVEETGANPQKLTLELTESVLVDDVDKANAKMNQLKHLGITFSLDDFGTGYSSLAYLHMLPINQLKIDRAFVAQVPKDANSAAIVRTILALGKALNLTVVAEGVENEEQLAFLKAEGCAMYQGYLFGRPLNISQFLSLASNRTTLHMDRPQCPR